MITFFQQSIVLVDYLVIDYILLGIDNVLADLQRSLS